ncbi:unnamed protein product [Schistosoma margrebowiei]|uniref:Uncharacterized protein n=1 Tax=Schistosoma margrebowiei TaxID=48269 RepID=A0A3P8CQH5_9TREM|nr:unnamed protein product [Schistosoma margrebowiei]
MPLACQYQTPVDTPVHKPTNLHFDMVQLLKHPQKPNNRLVVFLILLSLVY